MSRDRKPKPASKPQQSSKKQRGLARASAAMDEAAREEEAAQARSKPRKDKAKKPKPSTRAGKKGLVLYVQPEVTLALRKLALDNNSDVQRMGRRALELLFASYGKSLPGAPVEASAKS
jgi:hypothetical protein